MSARNGILELILIWAENNSGIISFSASDAHSQIDTIEFKHQASDALRQAWERGKLARKKEEKVFLYKLPKNMISGDGFELSQFVDKDEIEEQPKPEQKIRENKMQNKISENKDVAPNKPRQIPENPKPETETVKLPEGFCLKLETPSGITITITS